MASAEAPRAAAPNLEGFGDIVARNLRRLRVARGMSLSGLARDSGVARATLYQLEAGTGNPTLDTMFALASVLGVALSELVSDFAPPAVQIIRAGEAPLIPGPTLEARLLRRFDTIGGVIELYDLHVFADKVTQAHEHPPGVFEHVVLHAGHLLTGPAEDPVMLARGDYICFRADLPHMYSAIGGDAQATLVMHYPSAMGDAAPPPSSS